MSEKELSETISIAKAIGIILMVAGHTSGCIGRDFIYLFHMPLFFIISGLFFKTKYLDNKRAFVTKRLKRLYIPFIIWNFISLALHNYIYTLGIAPTRYATMDYFIHAIKILLFMKCESLLGPLWFLKSLFIGSCVTLLILWSTKQLRFKHILRPCLFVIMLFVGFLIEQKYGNYFIYDIHRELIIPSLIYLGILIRQHRLLLTPNLYVASACFLLLYFCSQYFTFDLFSASIVNPILLIPISTIGFYMILTFSYYLQKTGRIASLFVYIGKHTLIILILHLTAFKILSLILIHIFHFPTQNLSDTYYSDEGLWIIYTIVGVCLPLVGYEVYQKAYRPIIDNMRKRLYGKELK